MARILLATHDSGLFEIMAAELSGHGHEVIWAGDGQDAYATAVDETPNLVLLDMALPVFSGPELCAMLMEDPDIPAHLPIHLLTDEAIEPHLCERVGAAGVFPKTHEAHQLRDLVAAITLEEPFAP